MGELAVEKILVAVLVTINLVAAIGVSAIAFGWIGPLSP